MGINDVLAHATVENAVRVLKDEQAAQAALQQALQGLGEELVKALVDNDPSAPKRTAWKNQRLQNLMAQVHDILKGASVDTQRLVSRQLMGLVKDQAQAIPDLINGVLGVELAGNSLTEQQVRTIASDTLIEGAPSKAWWKKMDASLEHDFAAEIRKGLLAGENLGDLVKRIRGLHAQDGQLAFPGVLGKYRRNAQALVRTSWMTVANATSLATYKANADIMGGVAWLATLDPRTCAVCAALDGQQWGMEEAHPMAPKHWGCRCCLSPVVKSWEQLAKEFGGNTRVGRAMDKIPAGTRASMDGQVPAKLSYKEWEQKRMANATPAAPPADPPSPPAVPPAPDFSNLKTMPTSVEGFPIVHKAFTGKRAGRSMAAWDGTSILVNTGKGARGYWNDVAAEQQKLFDNGWLSSNDPNHVIWHELGHAKSMSQMSLWDRNMLRSMKMPQFKAVARKVSEYGSDNGLEFIAETFAALRAGRILDQDVLDMYSKLLRGKVI